MKSKVTENQLFSNSIISWYRENPRNLPWRETQDPYKIWLSEIILQQTRVVQGLPYYEAFSKAYPTVQALAEAPEAEVLRLWQGLGYYSRARNLHSCAKYIWNELGGNFPNTYRSLIQLKGLISALSVVNLRHLYWITSINEISEINPFNYPAICDIKTGNDSN